MNDTHTLPLQAMRVMNQRMNLPAMQKLLMDFERQNERMEMTSEMMGDAMDDAMEVSHRSEPLLSNQSDMLPFSGLVSHLCGLLSHL